MLRIDRRRVPSFIHYGAGAAFSLFDRSHRRYARLLVGHVELEELAAGGAQVLDRSSRRALA